MKTNEMPYDPEVLAAKLTDAMTPGAVVELDPGEAEAAGAFVEDAIREEDALASICDLYLGESSPRGAVPGWRIKGTENG